MALTTPRILRASSIAARSASVPDGIPGAEGGVSGARFGAGVPPGRLVEICAAPDAAQTSTAAMVLREAQAEGDPVAWIVPRTVPGAREGAASEGAGAREGAGSREGAGGRDAGLYPPDLAAAGLDLDALVVVHVPAGDPSAIARAAELVLRTGAFGAVVLDRTTETTPREQALLGRQAWQGRLLGLAREHACRVIVLSPHARTRASLGPLVSLRFDVRRARIAPGRFRVEARVVKDKLGIATETSATFAGPAGAR